MSVNWPECPASLKSIQHYLKTASEHDNRDPVVAYWCRLHAVQVGLKLSTRKIPEETKLLMALMDWLETEKQKLHDNESVTNKIAGQAYLENYALKLFLYADKADREGNFGKNVVKAFYTSGMIYDVLTIFGDLTEEVIQNRKYAKWKAAYIHNCLKNGETPVSGPLPSDDDEALEGTSNEDNINQPSTSQDVPEPPENTENKPSNIGFTAFPDQPFVPPPVGLLPSVPYTPDPNPGGFHAFVPNVPPPTPAPVEQANYPTLTPDQIAKAQKYCKWASSALTYDDVKTAVENLNNALKLLQTGHDPCQ